MDEPDVTGNSVRRALSQDVLYLVKGGLRCFSWHHPSVNRKGTPLGNDVDFGSGVDHGHREVWSRNLKKGMMSLEGQPFQLSDHPRRSMECIGPHVRPAGMAGTAFHCNLQPAQSAVANDRIEICRFGQYRHM